MVIEKMELIHDVLNDRKIEKCIFDILIGNTSENDPFPILLKECQAYIQDDFFYYKDLVDRIQREEDRQWDTKKRWRVQFLRRYRFDGNDGENADNGGGIEGRGESTQSVLGAVKWAEFAEWSDLCPKRI